MSSAYGRAVRAPRPVHFAAATIAASFIVDGKCRPLQMLYNNVPTLASPAPVVSLTASCEYEARQRSNLETLPRARAEIDRTSPYRLRPARNEFAKPLGVVCLHVHL